MASEIPVCVMSFTSHNPLPRRCHYPHLIGEKFSAQRSPATCLRSHCPSVPQASGTCLSWTPGAVRCSTPCQPRWPGGALLPAGPYSRAGTLLAACQVAQHMVRRDTPELTRPGVKAWDVTVVRYTAITQLPAMPHWALPGVRAEALTPRQCAWWQARPHNPCVPSFRRCLVLPGLALEMDWTRWILLTVNKVMG